MAKISLICEQCGGAIILDNSSEVGTCENCFSQFIIKQDQIVQKITQNITKHVYGYEGKDVEELLLDGYKLIELGDTDKANSKFRQAIEVEPDCWNAWFGYAATGGDRTNHLGMVPSYQKAYYLASSEQERMDTYVDMTDYLPDKYLRAAFVRAYNMASVSQRGKIFQAVLGVIGCDDSEIANLAIDLCPDDWRAHFAMAKFRRVRARLCKLEGLIKKHLPHAAEEVTGLFMRAYHLAAGESNEAKEIILAYINKLAADNNYSVLGNELLKRIIKENS